MSVGASEAKNSKEQNSGTDSDSVSKNDGMAEEKMNARMISLLNIFMVSFNRLPGTCFILLSLFSK